MRSVMSVEERGNAPVAPVLGEVTQVAEGALEAELSGIVAV